MVGPCFWEPQASLPSVTTDALCKHSGFPFLHAFSCAGCLAARGGHACGKGTPRASQHPQRAVLRSDTSVCLHLFMLLDSMIKPLFSLFLSSLGIPCGCVVLYVVLTFAGRLTACVLALLGSEQWDALVPPPSSPPQRQELPRRISS